MIIDTIKMIMSKESTGNSKRKIENLVVFIIILIITIIAINSIWNGKKTSKVEENESSEYSKQLSDINVKTNDTSVTNTDNDMEANLENILSKIEGVGNVKVLVTYSQSSEVIAMYNESNKNSTIEEKDSGGGIRTTEQIDTTRDVIYKEENGKKVPITQKVINPKVEGAIITAEGSNNAIIKNNIIQAVEAVTGLPTHKIQVFEMKKN